MKTNPDHVFHFRLSDDEKRWLKSTAAEEGISMRQYLHELLKHEMTCRGAISYSSSLESQPS